MAFASSRSLAGPVISSLGFSGAGFLTCYHLGVAQCLIDHGIIALNDAIADSPDTSSNGSTDTNSKTPSSSSFLPICGVSGGALVSAALAAHVEPRDGMDAVLKVSQRARSAGRLNVLSPGFSLIDAMEDFLNPLLMETDMEAFMRRIEHGKRFRIGLTDVRRLRLGRENAFVYVDSFQDMEDVIAACVLSSYVPGITGPALGSLDARNSSVLRSMKRLEDMFERGCVKDGTTHQVVKLDGSNNTREFCWDGGIANAFPYFDDKTTIITPLAVDFRRNLSINPSIEDDYKKRFKKVRHLPLSSQVQLHLTPVNGLTWKHILLSPTDDELQMRFDQGYQNAYTFLTSEQPTKDPEVSQGAAESGTAAHGLSQ